MTINPGAFSGCPFETIKINCNIVNNNNIVTILGNMSSPGSCQTTTAKTLRVALLQSLLKSFADKDLKDYVAGISLENPTNNTIINTILNKPDFLFELDLSNTKLTQDTIASMTPKSLPWTVITKNGTQKYEIQ